MDRICVVVPAYNDWESVSRLLAALAAVSAANNQRYRIFLVDDSSTLSAPGAWPGIEKTSFDFVKIVRLACNLGHQRAIAVGLVVARDERESCSAVVVMDGDGEDRPEDIPRLLALGREHPGAIVCARRARRSEPLLFRALYQVYKLLFENMTGVRIDFGNFCLIPMVALRAVVSQAGIWNHLAATVTRSRVPLIRVDTMRGVRYAGRSKMNFVSLVVHGLTAVAVYADVALARIVISATVLVACAFTGLVAIVCVRLLTSWAIPGWATNAAGALSILLLQSILIPSIGIFIVLSQRTNRTVIPLVDARDFIESVHAIFAEDEA